MHWVDAYIGIGSNLGDRAAQVTDAVDRVAATDGVASLRMSGLYETAPVGPKGQGAFLNAAAAVRTTRSARSLLDSLLAIERAMGRVRGERWGPRCIDLDLLMYGGVCIDEPGLCVPHPRLQGRWFVLRPLCDVAGAVVVPGVGETVEVLLGRVADGGV